MSPPSGSRLASLAALASVVALVSTPGVGWAQTTSEFQLWNGVFVTQQLSSEAPSAALWLDLHARRGADGTVGIVRPGVGFRASKWLSVWGGYAWIPVDDDTIGEASNEHRAWQQVILDHRFPAGVTLQSRTRLEQRFSDGGDDIGLRVRQFVRANWRPTPDTPVGLASWDELFLGLNETTWGQPGGIDQNRLFIGPFLQPTPLLRVEAGYLLAYLERDDSDRVFHAAALNVFLSPPPPAAKK